VIADVSSLYHSYRCFDRGFDCILSNLYRIFSKKAGETQHQIEKTADTTGIFDYLFLSKSDVVFLHITQRSR
jgi:hypothetical protein